MERKKILALGERLQNLLNKAEQEATTIVSEAQQEAERKIRNARETAEQRRLRAQRRTGLDEFLKDAEKEAEQEAVKVLIEFQKRAADIENTPTDKINAAAEYLVKEALPK